MADKTKSAHFTYIPRKTRLEDPLLNVQLESRSKNHLESSKTYLSVGNMKSNGPSITIGLIIGWERGYGGQTNHIIPPIDPDDLGAAPEKELSSNDSHLRSINEVIGYRIQAKDDKIGHVEDFVLDDGLWILRYL